MLLASQDVVHVGEEMEGAKDSDNVAAVAHALEALLTNSYEDGHVRYNIYSHIHTCT